MIDNIKNKNLYKLFWLTHFLATNAICFHVAIFTIKHFIHFEPSEMQGKLNLGLTSAIHLLQTRP